jgi:hypothetical protein
MPGPDSGQGAAASVPEESPRARVNRELIELLNEVRVALPGAQILFAFLLVLPFQARFAAINDLQRGVYTGALLSSAAAIALLIAPSSYHRLNFRRPVKERMLHWANRLLIAGMALTLVGTTLAVLLTLDFVFGDPLLSLVAALGTGAWFGWFWFALPLFRRRHFEGDEI